MGWLVRADCERPAAGSQGRRGWSERDLMFKMPKCHPLSCIICACAQRW